MKDDLKEAAKFCSDIKRKGYNIENMTEAEKEKLSDAMITIMPYYVQAMILKLIIDAVTGIFVKRVVIYKYEAELWEHWERLEQLNGGQGL